MAHNSTIKTAFDICVRCSQDHNDQSEKYLAHKKLRLCQYHNDKRKHEERKSKGMIKPLVKRAKKIKRFTSKRAAIERKINHAKDLKRIKLDMAGLKGVCESCGSRGVYLGMSHTISVKDCINSGDQRLIELAYDIDNLTQECHTGNNCHQVTESTHENSFKKKIEQFTFKRKMRIYKKFKRWLYDDIVEYISLNNIDVDYE